jgi:hypothetical protein
MAELIRQKLSAREVMQTHLKTNQPRKFQGQCDRCWFPLTKLMERWLPTSHSLEVGLALFTGFLWSERPIRNGRNSHTHGSSLRRDFVPDFDCRVVQRKKAGAIVIGKTNVPNLVWVRKHLIPCSGRRVIHTI